MNRPQGASQRASSKVSAIVWGSGFWLTKAFSHVYIYIYIYTHMVDRCWVSMPLMRIERVNVQTHRHKISMTSRGLVHALDGPVISGELHLLGAGTDRNEIATRSQRVCCMRPQRRTAPRPTRPPEGVFGGWARAPGISLIPIRITRTPFTTFCPRVGWPQAPFFDR